MARGLIKPTPSSAGLFVTEDCSVATDPAFYARLRDGLSVEGYDSKPRELKAGQRVTESEFIPEAWASLRANGLLSEGQHALEQDAPLPDTVIPVEAFGWNAKGGTS